VSITDRDKKIITILVPLLVLLGYWFLVLAPKRNEAHTVAQQLADAEGKRDTAQSQLSHLNAAKNSFAGDYATVIKLGKSVPTNLDMASLLVQLNEAAKGTGIEFTKVDAGQRSDAPASTPTSGSTPPGGGTGPTAPGAAPAASGVGQTAQNASAGVNGANAQNNANAAAQGGTGASGGSSGVAGLDSVPLNLEFRGNFFNLADLFHRLKRFVRVENGNLQVNGRLMTIDSLNFDATQSFPTVKANVTATVYLTPAAQGLTAGATPKAPAGAGATTTTSSSTSSSSTAPTATVTP
jgi:hypothetical protein